MLTTYPRVKRVLFYSWQNLRPRMFFFKDLLIYFREKESEYKQRGGAEGEKESPSDSPPGCRAQLRSGSHNPEIMTWAKIKSWMLNWLSPQVPHSATSFLKVHCLTSGYLWILDFPLLLIPSFIPLWLEETFWIISVF